MGRKTERIAALEQEVAELRRRASDDRHTMEATLDLLDEPYSWEAGGRAAKTLRSRLEDDPRPASAEGSLHWLHVADGDRLVWRLASELVALHDAEARRLGEPTWRHHRPASSQYDSHPEAQEPPSATSEPMVYDPSLVDALHDLERNYGALGIYRAVEAIWPAVAGTLRECPAEESP